MLPAIRNLTVNPDGLGFIPGIGVGYGLDFRTCGRKYERSLLAWDPIVYKVVPFIEVIHAR